MFILVAFFVALIVIGRDVMKLVVIIKALFRGLLGIFRSRKEGVNQTVNSFECLVEPFALD